VSLPDRIADGLAAARVVMVVGDCGTGRSSALLDVRARIGACAQYIDVARVATTPEQFLQAVVAGSTFVLPGGQLPPEPTSARDAFDAVLNFLSAAQSRTGEPVVFLLDDTLDLRTFEAFPGLKQALPELLAATGPSRNRFVLSSRFPNRAHKLLHDTRQDVPVIVADGWTPAEIAERIDAGHRGIAAAGVATAETARTVHALTNGRPVYVEAMLSALATLAEDGACDPVAALASLLSPVGRLHATCRYCYEFRLHRARGYGALKGILGILAHEEPLTLTHIARRLRRTPGSTKDYLLWLEDVDLIRCERKRYTVTDPLLRVWIRLNGKPMPPTEEDVAREVHRYAAERLTIGPARTEAPAVALVPVPARRAAKPDPTDSHARAWGIIEID
jgi:hypothetical protein